MGFQCQYAVIRFHRHGVLAPDYAILSTQEALLVFKNVRSRAILLPFG